MHKAGAWEERVHRGSGGAWEGRVLAGCMGESANESRDSNYMTILENNKQPL